jgi:sulfonate transport system ATP-binding protein
VDIDAMGPLTPLTEISFDRVTKADSEAGAAAQSALSHSADGIAVSVVDAYKRFGEHLVMENLSLTIDRGEFVALLGASGSGKTTLLRILLGLDSVDGGDVFVPHARTVVFQEPRLLPSRRVVENTLVGRKRTKAERDAALNTLAEVGLAQKARAWPRTLSGGEAQRVALARALVREPELLLLDEPFAALDALTRIKMHALVAELCARHRPAVLLVTHDVDEAIFLADRVLVLADRSISLDLSVNVPRPRNRSHKTFIELRQQLLGALGVSEEVAVDESAN